MKETFICDEGFNNWFGVDLPVYHCIFNGDYYDDHLFDIFEISFPESLDRSVVKRRAEHLAGRYCAIRSLASYGVHTNSIDIGRNRCPVWPCSTLGSISHCDGYAVAVSAIENQFSGVGIDIEEVVSLETARKLREQVFSKDELSVFRSSCQSYSHIFTLVFSVKESFFKAVYPRVGYYFDFDAVSVSHIDWSSRLIIFNLNYTLNRTFIEGMQFRGIFCFVGVKQIATLVLIDPVV